MTPASAPDGLWTKPALGSLRDSAFSLPFRRKQGRRITDGSLSHLATIPTLEELDVVSDDKVPRVHGVVAPGKPLAATLKGVWLSIGESISIEKIRHLQEIRPDLTVYYSWAARRFDRLFANRVLTVGCVFLEMDSVQAV